jgi:hypothetical protein
MNLPNFIIGGTEKAGTTSVFGYLAVHPQVAVSSNKETDFFRKEDGAASDYASHFASAGDQPILLEASPAYLGEAAEVAPRIRAMLPDVKLLFILRNPIDRFVSSYHFHHGRLNLPQELGFHEYLQLCLAHADDRLERRPGAAAIDDWYLDVLPFGRYAQYLRCYFDLFPREQVRVVFFDDLRDNPEQFMRQLSAFMDIDPQFWATASFERRNVTFAGRHKWLHRIALGINSRLERVLLRRPGLKARLLRIYKFANRAAPAERTLAAGDRSLLEAFYESANRDLEALLGVTLPADWNAVQPQSLARPDAARPVCAAQSR